MGLIVLDTCVVADLPGLNARAQALRDWIGSRKQQGHEVVVVPQVVAEGEQLREPGADARLVTIESWCDGLIGHDAAEILAKDLVLEDPAQEFRRLRVVKGLFYARRHREQESFQEFLRSQRDGYAVLDATMPEFARKLSGVKLRVEPYREYVTKRQMDHFRGLVRYCIEKGYAQVAMPDDAGLERMWGKALAYRLVALVVTTNEYRIGARMGKLKGSMKDLRVLFESAYADEFVTMDGELYECGNMLFKEGLIQFPKFVKWPVAS